MQNSLMKYSIGVDRNTSHQRCQPTNADHSGTEADQVISLKAQLCL
jgi:hypothetical protein